MPLVRFGAFSTLNASLHQSFQLNNMASEKLSKRNLVVSSPVVVQHKVFKHTTSQISLSLKGGRTGQIVFFLLKVAALETVRRISKARCPFVWRAVQALPVLGYLPFKWIQRWAPLRIMVEGVQKCSRPLLFLSIATTFSDKSEKGRNPFNGADVSRTQPDLPSRPSTSDTRNFDESPRSIISENWLLELLEELEKQGITLPERINGDELRRFYTAANGDFSCLLSSVKRTIRWRETYYILSIQELETWSHLVFWHGLDVMLRPCLVIRLGLACSSIVPDDRPRFAQAIVSQIEFGVLHLLNEKDPHITVLVDCEGLSPFSFPMQMLRSCSTLVQDHYPNRLGTLFVVRLPPIVRVIAQTFIQQVLKPTTRQKLRVEGEAYRKVLSDILEAVPAFLGGNCNCTKCGVLLSSGKKKKRMRSEEPYVDPSDNDETALDAIPIAESPSSSNCDHLLRVAIVSMLVLWIFIAFLAGMHDPEPRWSSQL